MGTKRTRNSKRQGEGASNNRRLGMKKDVVGPALFEVIERERRNLQRASAVLASLTVAVMYEEEEMAAGDVAYVARGLIDQATDALDVVELERAAKRQQPKQPP